MKVVTVKWLILVFVSVCCVSGEDVRCTTLEDEKVNRLLEAMCYLSCLSDALNKLYADGGQKLLVNDEVYANASLILDDMEGKSGESVKYLSVISGSMEGKHEELEKLISYGNEMGDLVAKVGGLFAEVNESVRAVRKELPGTLIKANKYYTAILEITRTIWDDVKSLQSGDNAECENHDFQGIRAFQVRCGDHTCPLKEGVNESTLQEYKDGCLDINAVRGSVSECLSLPRNQLYKNGAAKNSGGVLKWKGENGDHATLFQITMELKDIFLPLIAPFSAGQLPSALLDMMSNIITLYSHFNKVHNNFTSLLVVTNRTNNLSSPNSTI